MIFTKRMSIFLYLFGDMEKTGGWGPPSFACSQFTWLVQVTCAQAFELHLLLPPSYLSPVMCGTWGVGSPTRDGPGAPCSGSGVLTTESPHPAAFCFHWKSHSPDWGFLPSLACPLLGPPPLQLPPQHHPALGLHPPQDFLLLPAHPSASFAASVVGSFTLTSSLCKRYLNYIDYFRNSDNSRGMLKDNLFFFNYVPFHCLSQRQLWLISGWVFSPDPFACNLVCVVV